MNSQVLVSKDLLLLSEDWICKRRVELDDILLILIVVTARRCLDYGQKLVSVTLSQVKNCFCRSNKVLPRRMLTASFELVTHCLSEFMISGPGSWVLIVRDSGEKTQFERSARVPSDVWLSHVDWRGASLRASSPEADKSGPRAGQGLWQPTRLAYALWELGHGLHTHAIATG